MPLFPAIWMLYFVAWLVRDASAHHYGWVVFWGVGLLLNTAVLVGWMRERRRRPDEA